MTRQQHQHPLQSAVEQSQNVMLAAADLGDPSTNPFIVVDGSSGSGKTQSAFVLECPVMYFLLIELGDSSQRIYRSVQFISNELYRCLELDLKQFFSDTPVITTNILLTRENICLRSASLLMAIGQKMFRDPSKVPCGVAGFSEAFGEGSLPVKLVSFKTVRNFF